MLFHVANAFVKSKYLPIDVNIIKYSRYQHKRIQKKGKQGIDTAEDNLLFAFVNLLFMIRKNLHET